MQEPAAPGPAARIGVDAFNIAMAKGTGVATYARVLTSALEAMGHPVDVLYGTGPGPRASGLFREVSFFDSLESDAAQRRPPFPSPRWAAEAAASLLRRPARAVPVPIGGRVLSRDFADRMPAFDRILGCPGLWGRAERHFRRTGRFLEVRAPDPPAVMHWTYPLPIRMRGARNVYTMHDLVPLRMPHATLDHKGRYLRLVRGCARWGDHVCTVSESSRRDIVDLLGVPPSRVTNTFQSSIPAPGAVDEAGLDAWLQGLFGLRRDGYILFFGALEPKKNVGRLLEAYLGSGIETPLVLVGGRSWKAEADLRLIQPDSAAAGAGTVLRLDYVPGRWLTSLVRGARAVAFPSLAEGFGLPALEAMQLGVPVLAGGAGGLPEVVGGAALVVDPYDVAAIALGLRRLDGDPALRAALAAAGPLRARSFSMPEYQARLRALYATVLSTPPGGIGVRAPRG